MAEAGKRERGATIAVGGDGTLRLAVVADTHSGTVSGHAVGVPGAQPARAQVTTSGKA